MKSARSEIELLGQELKCGGCDLSWVLPKLVIEVRMIMRIHAALENLSIRRSVKKPSCNPQRADAIIVCPSIHEFCCILTLLLSHPAA